MTYDTDPTDDELRAAAGRFIEVDAVYDSVVIIASVLEPPDGDDLGNGRALLWAMTDGCTRWEAIGMLKMAADNIADHRYRRD